MIDKNEYENVAYQFKIIIDKIDSLKNYVIQLENTEKNNLTINDDAYKKETYNSIKNQLDTLDATLRRELNSLKETYNSSLLDNE